MKSWKVLSCQLVKRETTDLQGRGDGEKSRERKIPGDGIETRFTDPNRWVEPAVEFLVQRIFWIKKVYVLVLENHETQFRLRKPGSASKTSGLRSLERPRVMFERKRKHL